MEKDRRAKLIAVIALVIAVIGLSIGFAAYSTTLTIGGSATVKASSWKIMFENLSASVPTGTATEVTAPTINNNDTNIGDYSVSFTTPGDTISYTFDITNDGTFNAEISSLTIPTPTCTGTGDNAEVDASNVCSNIEYTLKYTDSGLSLAEGDALNANNNINVTLTLTYKSTIAAENLPLKDVSISNLGISIIYSQV